MKMHLQILVAIAVMGLPLGAQQKYPDLNGVWQGPYTPDLSRTLPKGEPIPFTPYASERFAKVDPANNPDGFCLPVGPARGFQSPAPFQLVQNDNTVAILFENQRIFRIIYLDGTKHPDDISDYPEWMGHSVGHWEGDALVVDTVGFNEGTWIDMGGKPHTDKLHLIERFTRTDLYTLHYEATIDDSGAYTAPWKVRFDVTWDPDGEIQEYICQENNLWKDRVH